MAVKRSNLAPRTREEKPSMERAMPAPDQADPLKHLTVQIPESLRRDLKAWAAAQGMSLREVIDSAIREKIGK